MSDRDMRQNAGLRLGEERRTSQSRWFYTMSDFWYEDAAGRRFLKVSEAAIHVSCFRRNPRHCFSCEAPKNVLRNHENFLNFPFFRVKSSSSTTGFNSRNHTSIILWKKNRNTSHRDSSWCQIVQTVRNIRWAAWRARLLLLLMSADVESSLPAARGPQSVCSTVGWYFWTRTRRWWTDCQSHGGIRRIGEKKTLQCLTFYAHFFFWEITKRHLCGQKTASLLLILLIAGGRKRFMIQIKCKCSGVKRCWLEAGVVFRASLKKAAELFVSSITVSASWL